LADHLENPDGGGARLAVARVVRRGPQDPAQMMSAIAAKVPGIGSAVLTAAAMTLFAFILTLYLLADGRSTYEWVFAYVPRAHRAKANETVAGVTEAVFAYVAGNLLTSLFAAVFILVSLTLLRVPAAFILAVLAGVCDFVPILGFFVRSPWPCWLRSPSRQAPRLPSPACMDSVPRSKTTPSRQRCMATI
jgi:predicted PurR-regulated permease PerM